MTINDAAIQLTLAIFGHHTAFLKSDRVRAADNELHVRTCLPPDRWSKNRIADFAGLSVKWVHVTKESA